MLKGKSMDALMRDATECGASKVIPLETEHTEARFNEKDIAKKMTHWREQMIAAAKQCGNLTLPELEAPCTLEDLLKTPTKNTITLLCSLEENTPLIANVLESARKELKNSLLPTVRILIGPEGDFSQREYTLLQESGATPVRLARQVLRAPTAALYALGVADQFLQSLEDV